MSEHTPLAEAERIEQAIYDVAVDHSMWIGDDGQPLDYLPEREARIGNFVRQAAASVLDALASTATADIGLRERVEAELRSEDATAVLYGVVGTHPDSYGGVTKDEALEHACDLLRRLRAVLDAPAVPTTDTGARD